MGLRNWITRPIKGHQIGVEDLTAGGSGIPVSLGVKSNYLIHWTNVPARKQGGGDGHWPQSMPRPFRSGWS